MKKETFYCDCMDCGNDWEIESTKKDIIKDYQNGDIMCPKCHSGDVAISDEDGKTFGGEKFEKVSLLKECIKEAKMKKSKVNFTAFDINNKKTGEKLFSTNADNGADQVDKKLTQAKFKKILKDLEIIRYTQDGSEDVTKAFI